MTIALAEKSIPIDLPFDLLTEVPRDSTTQTPFYNTLEKLPVLILEKGESTYESLEFIEAKYTDFLQVLPKNDVDSVLFAKKVEFVTDGIRNALVLLFFEKQTEDGKRGKDWMARQRKNQSQIFDGKFSINDCSERRKKGLGNMTRV